MSYPHFQSALALLLRLPNHYRGNDLGSFLERYELTDLEKKRLEIMAHEVKLAKYGRTMSGIRWEYITDRMRWSLRYLPKPTTDLLWSTFEPTVPHLRGSQLAYHFLDFLLTSPMARETVAGENRPYLFDLFRVEMAQAKLWRNGGKSVIAIPENSYLQHTQFELLDLQYDFPLYLETLSGPGATEAWEAGPNARAIKLLVMEDQQRQMRFFEIDLETETFLRSQLSGEDNSNPRPPTYTDLQRIGLCKTIN